ncbi:MAG: MBL fold metallo-hydrolase [Candidatus Eisenbacteria bacterium]
MTIRICSLASGSSGNATLIASETTAVLVDCGLAARQVEARLASLGVDPCRLDGILVTHAHADHYRSAGTMHRRYRIPVHVDPSTAWALALRPDRTSWSRISEPQPIPDRIGDLEIRALDTRHGDPRHDGRTVAYRIEHAGWAVAVVTDLGRFDDRLIAALRGVDAIVLEANYDEAIVGRKLSDPRFARDWPYLRWVQSDRGHLSNRQCAEALAEIVRDERAHVLLGHVSENHFDPRRDNNDHRIAFDAVARELARRRLPLPILHRTYRVGRVPAGCGAPIEIGA